MAIKNSFNLINLLINVVCWWIWIPPTFAFYVYERWTLNIIIWVFARLSKNINRYEFDYLYYCGPELLFGFKYHGKKSRDNNGRVRWDNRLNIYSFSLIITKIQIFFFLIAATAPITLIGHIPCDFCYRNPNVFTIVTRYASMIT